jgi:hypothetical protein
MELGGGGTMYTYVSKCKNDKRRKKSDRKKERMDFWSPSLWTLFMPPLSPSRQTWCPFLMKHRRSEVSSWPNIAVQ